MGLEKGSDDIGSAVCVLKDRQIVYIVSQTADPISSEPISRHTLCIFQHFFKETIFRKMTIIYEKYQNIENV